MERTFCIGIDLDDLRYYRGIHALVPRPDTPLVFTAAVPRFLGLCDRLGLHATLFTIGEDLKWEDARAVLAQAATAGHEVASHSQSHSYALSRMDPEAIAAELTAAKSGLEDAIGREVVGFRGPGYNLSEALLDALRRTGHRYDSSIIPAPAYYLARAAIIGGMRCVGRRSASIVGRGRDFFRGREPFVWDELAGGPYGADDNGEVLGLREFPITTAGVLRMPLIGTVLARGGWWSRRLVTACDGLPFVNVEFHALDFLGIDEDGIEPELRVEPALRVPLATRIKRYEDALRKLMEGRKAAVLRDLV